MKLNDLGVAMIYESHSTGKSYMYVSNVKGIMSPKPTRLRFCSSNPKQGFADVIVLIDGSTTDSWMQRYSKLPPSPPEPDHSLSLPQAHRRQS
jgi:hypothetical protein